MIQYSTTNKSFLSVHESLKALGVQNNHFFLELMDESLIDIDPHSVKKDAPLKLRRAIYNECCNNPWYYLREVVLMQTQGGVKRFELNLGNLALIWCSLNNINTIVRMARCNYLTMSITILLDWMLNFGTEDSTISIRTKTVPAAELSLHRFSGIVIPKFMQHKSSLITRNKNINELYNPITLNALKYRAMKRSTADVMTAGSKELAEIQWFHEFNTIPFFDVFHQISKLMSCISRKTAIARGAYSFTILEEVPSISVRKEVQAYIDTLKSTMKTYYPKIYDLEHSKYPRDIYLSFNYKELERDEEWFNNMCILLNRDEAIIKRELLLEY